MAQGKYRSVKRRQFLSSVAALPLLGIKGDQASHQKSSTLQISGKPDSPLRLGLIGFGQRGEELFQELRQLKKDAHIQAVCEIFDQRLHRALNYTGDQLRGYHNYQDLLKDEDIDAVVIATPDHWHARMAMEAACQGKHIYLETSMSRNLEEAKAVREAVRTSGVVFQLGHQGRQRDLNHKARDLLSRDILGKISLIETTTNRNEVEGLWKAVEGEQAQRENIDWELFQGPTAGKHPFSPERYYGWRNFWEYGNGMSGELLGNEFDMVNSILDLGIPASAIATGGLYYHRDGREVPDVFQAAFEYPGRALTLLYSGTLSSGIPRGTLFMGRDASLELGRILSVWVDKQSLKYKSRIQAGIIDPAAPFVNYMQDPGPVDGISSATAKYYADRGLKQTYREGKQLSTTRLHLAEWLNCIRSGRLTSCHMDRAFEVAVATHMASRSYLEGRKVSWDQDDEVIL
jgi:predicted dehydrogenase